MRERLSYKDQFTTWHPNHTVLTSGGIASADQLQLVKEYHLIEEDFGKFEETNDLLESSLYANGVCMLLIRKSQKAYRGDCNDP